jgi:NAD(P)-dependent dehydrogenase (short-subunit alcohol dehydrogenase family)
MSSTSSPPVFAEKVVLITGGTGGIGRATAVAFAGQGANVVVTGRRKAEGQESVAFIAGDFFRCRSERCS